MAFSYIAMPGSVTQMAKEFIDQLDTLMQQGGFSFVETVTNGTYYAKVWKSAVEDNGTHDFYISCYTSTYAQNSVYFGLAEAYDSGTHRLKKYVPYTSSSWQVDQTDHTVDDTVGQLLTATNGYFAASLLLNSTSMSYHFWASITPQRVHLATRNGIADYAVFAGYTENLLPLDSFPTSSTSLAIASSMGAASKTQGDPCSSTLCGFTREPGQTSAYAGNWVATCSSTYTYPYFAGSSGLDWTYKAGGAVVQRPAFFSGRDAGALWIPRALFPRGHVFSARISNAVNGDTLTMGVKTYVRMGIGSAGHIYVDNSL